MKSGVALQPSAGNAEGCGNGSHVCTTLIRKGEWKRYWRDGSLGYSDVSRDQAKKEMLFLKGRFMDHFFAKNPHSLVSEISSTH